MLLLSVFASLSIAQDYSITNWYNNKKAAVCLTFDDWYSGQPDLVIPEMTSRGIGGTFYINAQYDDDNKAFDARFDHEITNHSRSHHHVNSLSDSAFHDEVLLFDQEMTTFLSPRPTLTFAYPFGSGGGVSAADLRVQDTLKKYFIAARGVWQGTSDGDPAFDYNYYDDNDKYYQLRIVAVSDGITKFSNRIRYGINGGGLVIPMYHGFSEGTFDMVPFDDFKQQLDTLEAHKDVLWIVPLYQAIQYHREKKSAVLTEVNAPFASGDTWELALTDGLDDSKYFQDLTIRLKIDASIPSIDSVTQNGMRIAHNIIADSVEFNATPDAGNIILHLNNCTPPQIALSTIGEATFCLPDSILLTTHYQTGYSYEWLKDSVMIPGETNDSIYISSTGEYSVIVDSAGCKANSAIYNQTVVLTVTGVCGEPVADFVINPKSALIGETVTLTNTSTNLTGTESYTWVFEDTVTFIPSGTRDTKITGEGPIQVQFENDNSETVKLVVSGDLKNDSISKDAEILTNFGCLYSTHFDDAVPLGFMGGSWDNYQTTAENSSMTINVPDFNTSQWYYLVLNFNDGVIDESIDFSHPSKTPVVKFRARASDTVTMTFNLADVDGHYTGNSKANPGARRDLTTEWQEFEFNFTGAFYNEWSADYTDVDSTRIGQVQIAFNSGYQNFPFTNSFGQEINESFVGTVEIEWVGIGEDCYLPPHPYFIMPESVCVEDSIELEDISSGFNPGASYDVSFEHATLISQVGDFHVIEFDSVMMNTITLTVDDGPLRYTYTDSIQVLGCATGIEITEVPESIYLYPNPVSSGSVFMSDADVVINEYTVYDNTGVEWYTSNHIHENELHLPMLENGVYMILANTSKGNLAFRVIVED